jgi:CRISPR-associated protein Csb2
VGNFQSKDRVPLCVAVHRALASGLGDGAPAFITGRYTPGVRQPPNRLAIQLLEAGHPGVADPSIALLIPPGISDVDLAALARAIDSVRRVWVPRSKVAIELRHDEVVERDAERFWRPRRPGQMRVWMPAGALVPEVRRQKSGDWTLADAAALSAAFVCRDSLGVRPASGGRRYADLVAAASERGVRVHNARLLNDSRAALYAHKMPDGVPVTPYQAWVEMGDLMPSRALFALGQSRHLGGGLMLPVDLDVATARAMGLRP